MNRKLNINWRRGTLALGITVLLILAVIAAQPEKEIALVIGEPYEDMRQRSSASINPAIAGHFAFNTPKSDARLRFVDPQYGFVTPPARFFAIFFETDETVTSLRMSPQIEPLLFEDTFKILLDLQEQWRNAGWHPIWTDDNPLFADTAESRIQLNEQQRGVSYWRAADKYQITLSVRRFPHYKHPTEERYLITLSLSNPYGRYWPKP